VSVAVQATWDEAELAALARRMQALKSQLDGGDYPLSKVLRNAARDFAQSAYAHTRSAAVRRTPFLQVPDKRGGRYLAAYEAAVASNLRNHGGRHELRPGMYVRGGMRWIRKARMKNPGSRGGTTGNPPYPVAKGFARATWIGVFRGLGMTTQRPAANVPESATRAGQAEQRPREIVLTDRLSYIERLDRMDAIVSQGMEAARSRLQRGCEEKARQLEQSWVRWMA
jgi:hypothetical protein